MTPIQDHAQLLDDVSRTGIQLLLKEPFYGHFFIGLLREITTHVDTLAVGQQQGVITFYINPVFWTERLSSLPLRLGGVKHEILHIVFRHIFRHTEFNHKGIFNVAADLVVNQYIDEQQLIEGAVRLLCFPELKLSAFENVNYYYTRLMQLYQENTQGESGESESWENLKAFLRHNHHAQQGHEGWRSAELRGRLVAETEIALQQVDEAIRTSLARLKSKDFGTLPGALRSYLGELTQRPLQVVNWRRVLRLFAAGSTRTRIKNTLRRPSKRYGTSPGIRVQKIQKILVAIDTSGSISADDSRAFFAEVHHLWKRGAEVQVAECDTQITRTYAYKGIWSGEPEGGGGTSFEAPILYANTTYRPDALIYFTDGYGPKPTVRCQCPVLWLICRMGTELVYLKDFQGRKVKM